jgi:protein SCO1/2
MRRVIYLIAGFFLIAVTAIVGLEWSATQRPYYAHKLPHPEEAYDFKLTDGNGRSFQLDQLRGKLVLLTFGFTHCPNICPTTLGNLAALYRDLSSSAKARTQVVFVTVDPERDTPKVMKDYMPEFNDHFIGLTGSAEQIRKTAKAYGVVYERQPLVGADETNSYTINHSAYLYVIGPKGKWIALYDYDQIANSRKIASDVERFLAWG